MNILDDYDSYHPFGRHEFDQMANMVDSFAGV